MSHLFSYVWLLRICFLSFIISVCYSHPLWWVSESHIFPVIPVAAGLYIPVWLDNFLIVLFFAVIAVCSMYNQVSQRLLWLSLFLFVLLVCFHVSRLQPWSVFFMGMLVIIKSDTKHTRLFMLLFLTGMYVWSNVFKLNFWYHQTISPEFCLGVENITGINANSSVLQFILYALPFIMMVSMILIHVNRLKIIIAVGIIFYHLVVIIVLGFWRNNPNYVIWPWNLALVIFWIHFIIERKKYAFRNLITHIQWKKSLLPLVAVVWMFIFPAFWFTGRVSSTACFHLYSGLGNEGSMPATEVMRYNCSIWRGKELYYSIDLDYTQQCGVPFPDAPGNYRYVEAIWKKKGIIKKGNLLIEKYTFGSNKIHTHNEE